MHFFLLNHVVPNLKDCLHYLRTCKRVFNVGTSQSQFFCFLNILTEKAAFQVTTMREGERGDRGEKQMLDMGGMFSALCLCCVCADKEWYPALSG